MTNAEREIRDRAMNDGRQILVENAVRWASNILVEVQSNHGRFLTEPQSEALRRACMALADFMSAARIVR